MIFLDRVNGKSGNYNYMMDDKFSLFGKFNSWQLNEESGSYKAKEKKLLSQKDSELRSDYKYGNSCSAIERLGGNKKILILTVLMKMALMQKGKKCQLSKKAVFMRIALKQKRKNY